MQSELIRNVPKKITKLLTTMEPSMKNIFKWKILSGNELPSAFFELRESVYGKEKEYFPLE